MGWQRCATQLDLLERDRHSQQSSEPPNCVATANRAKSRGAPFSSGAEMTQEPGARLLLDRGILGMTVVLFLKSTCTARIGLRPHPEDEPPVHPQKEKSHGKHAQRFAHVCFIHGARY